MAKNKKSKILAMALCASVMAGIYASPVMAKEFPLDSNSSVTTETTISTGGYTQNEVRVNISDGISSDTIGTFYSNEEEAGFKTDYTMTASTFTLEAEGRTWASLTVNGLTYTNPNTLNNVSLTADGLTFSNLGNPEATAVLNAAAINSWNEKTQNIDVKRTSAGTTAFVGSVIADSFGTTKVNGNRAFWVNKDGKMEAAYGKFAVDAEGNITTVGTVDGVEVSAIGTNTAGITRENVTKNITKTNIENSSITSAGELYINKANGQTNFSVDKYGNANVRNYLIANGISVNNDRFTVDEYGTVKSESDFRILDEKGNEKYSLNPIGTNTAGIDRVHNSIGYDTTTIEGTLNIRSDGYISNATNTFSINQYGELKAAGGKFVVDDKGNITTVGTVGGVDVSKLSTAATDISDLQNRTQYITGASNDTTYFKGVIRSTGDISSGNGAVTLSGNYGKEAAVTLRDAEGKHYALTATQLGNINNMITGAGVLENVVSINGAAVEGVGNGGLKISGVELENGLINGVNINDLDKAVAGTSANIGGIERSEGAGDPGTGTTTIENNLKVSGDKINMFGDTGLTFEHGTMNNVDIINVSGNIGFNGSNVHFSYGSDGKTNTLGGLALTVDQIATDVSAIKEKTDHITVDDKGNVTISADDGSSLTVGKDGTSTGQGGQVTTDGNHTVNGDLDVDGSGQIDKDLTVGGDLEVGGKIDASEVNVGNTHITKDNGIETDKITVSGQGGSAIINGGYVGGSNDVFIDANGNNIFDEGETSLSGVNGKVDKVASDLGDVSILDPEIAGDSNDDGQNDVVGAVNNEAEIRRSEIERVDGRINNLENRVGELEDRIDKVGAMAAAIANLRTMGYDPAAPTEVAVGIGQYRDETGAALGLFHYPNRDFMLSLSVSTSGDEVMGGIGATWKFGRKSPEKVAEIKKAQAEADARRAEEAKLAKAEEMKQAAKEAKIKAQQERHAKLAAERAAQAEAAK